jgi:acyl carrier protein
MQREALLSELKLIIADYLVDEDKVKLDTVTETTNLLNELKIDSIDLVDIVINTETKFGIQIPNETIATMTTVGKCLDVIEAKLVEK